MLRERFVPAGALWQVGFGICLHVSVTMIKRIFFNTNNNTVKVEIKTGFIKIFEYNVYSL